MPVKKTKTEKTTKAAKLKKTVLKEAKPQKTAKKTPKKTQEELVDVVVPIPGGDKLKIITEFATKQGDTGSPEVQIALLTRRIEKLVGHLKTNPQDNHSRRGLLGMVSKRRRLINYLTKKDEDRAKDIAGKLKLGK